MRIRLITKKTILYIALLFFALSALLPYLWILSTAFKNFSEIFTIPIRLIPKHLTLENFKAVIYGQMDFGQKFTNSLIVTTATTLLTLAVSIPCAYALTRFRMKGRRILLQTILVSQMIPIAVLLIPLYILIVKLGLLNTFASLVITNLTFSVPFVVWVLYGFFTGLPISIEESAMIDGCSRFQTLIKIVLPSAAPGLAASSAYTFITAWQEYMFALTFIDSQKKFTLPIALTSYIGQYGTQWGNLMAASLLVTLPVIVLFFGIQTLMVKGLTAGAVKG
jgi:ABC-type glycerol-3-phosphate transport system permease component